MPLPICDIPDRSLVMHGNEINQLYVEAMKTGVTEITPPGIPPMRLDDWRDLMMARYQRLVQTSRILESIREGRVNLVDSATRSAAVH